MTDVVLELSGVSKQYRRFSLGPIDMRVEKGTAVALIGTNGSGKSTLFRLIMNILQLEAGLIKLFGHSSLEKEVEIKEKIGFVGGQFSGIGYLTIKEMAALVSKWYPSWTNERYEQLLSRYQLDEREKFLQCSSGNQKKVEFIFSLAHQPDLLLLDEPSTGLDIVSQRKMKEDLLNYLESGEKSMLIATHSVDEVMYLCDYIYVLDQGKLINQLEKDGLYDKWARVWVSNITHSLKEHPHVLKTSENPCQLVTDNLEEIERELGKEGITIIHLHRLGLDEVIEYLIEKTTPGK